MAREFSLVELRRGMVYALSKKRIIGRNMILLVLVGTMTVPPTALLLPLYFIITKMGMYDTLIRIEAARMDGCGDVRIFLQIIVPLVKPALVTLVLIEFVNNWNSFTMPLVLLQSESKYTLPLRLGLLASENVALPWSQILAANLLTMIPVVVLFLLLQKQFSDILPPPTLTLRGGGFSGNPIS